MEDGLLHARSGTPLRFVTLVLVCLVLLVGCLQDDPKADLQSNPQLFEGARDTSLGPDICRIQDWAAQSMAVVNGRTPEQANYDRVAWNLAQYHISTLLDKRPGIRREDAIRETTVALEQLYKGKTPDVCPLVKKNEPAKTKS